jgi:hypothetical protein
MGCFNWFFKILGIILMLIVIVLLPITVLANELGGLLFSTDNVFTMIDEELINSDFMEETIGELMVEFQTEGEGIEEDAMRESIKAMVEDIPTETMNEALAILFPIEMVSDLFGEISDGFYIWLNSEGYQTGILIDMSPLKINVTENISTVMAMVFEEMPECNVEELSSWNMTCNPSEEFDAKVNEIIDEQTVILLEDIPDQFYIDEYLTGQGSEMAVMRNTLILVRDVLNYVWVLVIGILLMGIFLGARTIQGFFSWAGWPLLITSMVILMIGILFNISSEEIINFGISRTGVSIPTFLAAPAHSILGSILGLIGSGMIGKGLIIFAVGVVAIILSEVISTYRYRNSQKIKSGSDEELLSDLKTIERYLDHKDME